MSCEDVAIAITEAALEGAPHEPALDAHVESCAACRDELAALRRTARRVRAAKPASSVAEPARGPSPLLAVSVSVLVLVLVVALPALLADRGPSRRPAPAPLPEASPIDPQLVDRDARTLLAHASVAALTSVADVQARALTAIPADAALDDPLAAESTDLLIARLDGPSVERALARLGR